MTHRWATSQLWIVTDDPPVGRITEVHISTYPDIRESYTEISYSIQERKYTILAESSRDAICASSDVSRVPP
ncbi:hypothetical protein E2C01_011078 [Portunus trituberculatus]|uniref:Uncharacterized protein n=1 Tax=Portunus trituberculatus TaxID=210409 RepID=A0A5B7DA52_PORTR|nr:hypothetical protein [Portunus trituberculatus]